MDTNSYRGITLTPALAKVLELILILDCLQDMLMEKGLPHLNQTGYQKRLSCTVAIFSTLEVISQLAQQGEKMHLCLMTFKRPSTQCNTQVS